MEALTNVVALVLVNWLPFDPMTRTTVGIVLSQLLHKFTEYITKHGVIHKIWFLRRLFAYNTVKFSSENYQFYNLIDYYHKKFNHIIKDTNIVHVRGNRHLMIDALSQNSIIDVYDGQSYYIQVKKSGENKVDDVMCSSYNIIFSSNQSTIEINKYIEHLAKTISRSVDHEFCLYSINVEKSDKHRKLSWNFGRSVSNKTKKNVLVSDKVQKDFYDDMETFWGQEESYNKRGITFKRGYLIHGTPGSGKSSLISSIINEYELPVFKFDMSVIQENDELNKLNDTIYDYIGMSEKHLLLLEDIDRCRLFDRWNRGSGITMDAVLNMLDGIGGTHGRITIMTANNISELVQVQGLLRPGRIDRIIELSNCEEMQINRIISLNFDKDVDEVKIEGVKTTPANLNKLIQILDDYELVIKYLGKHKNLNDDDLENIDLENKESAIDTKPKMKMNRRGRVIKERKKSDKPRGFDVIERLKRKIKKEEIDLGFSSDKQDIDFQIRSLQFKKMRIELEQRQKIFDEQQTKVDTKKEN